MSVHTRGPWTSHDRNIWAGEILLAKVYRQGDEGEPNAHLIAAAPEMLEALQEAEPHIRGLGSAHALAAVRAAIAKAKVGSR